LPPYSPELDSVERVGLHLKERFLSDRLHADYDAIADAAYAAGTALLADVGRITTPMLIPPG
jgi:transposase